MKVMMKKLWVYMLSIITLMAGCEKKTDELFAETPDERLGEVLQAYKSSLVQAPGWKLFVYPQGLVSQDVEVGGLTYYVQFPDSNRVNMVSDFTLDMAAVPKESGYRLRGTQRPSVVFDTYSYIHAAADPDETVSFSPTNSGGFGWGTDFDFSFTETVPGDTIRLKGNFNSSDAYMIRATEEEMTAAFNGTLAHILQATADYSESNPFLFFSASDNAQIGVSFNLFLYRINFTYLADGSLSTINAPFSHTTYGLHLKDPVTVGGFTFQDLFYDDNTHVYYIETSGGRKDILNSNNPLFPFHLVLGKFINTISVPVEPLDGQSPSFTAAHEQIKTSLINGPFGLELSDIDFIFDAQSMLMAMNVNVRQDGSNFIAQYIYGYTMNTSNIATFTLLEFNGNASLIQPDMAPLLNHIENDVFKLDYFTGTLPVLGQFISQTDPSFYFTGNLE
jgi:hypothetical protein